MMTKRTTVAALVISLVAAACTTTGSADSTERSTEATSTIPPTRDASSLVTIDASGDLVIIDKSGAVIQSIEPPDGALYAQPIWASAETIVHAQVATENHRLEAVRLDGEEVWSVELDTPPFYYLAAPDSDGTTVVSLRNKASGQGLVIERVSGEAVPETVSGEAPFYASWHPTDGRLASHVGDMRVDVASASTETIDTNASGFQAPLWLPSGLVTLRTRGGDTYLTRWDDSSFDDIAIVRGAARFVGSHESIAIVTGGDIQTGGVQASAQSLPTITSGVLTAIDLEQDSFTSVTSEPSPMFQWDPAGQQLLYVTFIDDPNPALVWHVWRNGETTDFEPFVPEPTWFATVAPFFDQYAQSVSLWSHDGSAFAYPAVVDGEPRILVQHLDEPSPRDIASGTWVAWNPG
jgi:hypothetical protein